MRGKTPRDFPTRPGQFFSGNVPFFLFCLASTDGIGDPDSSQRAPPLFGMPSASILFFSQWYGSCSFPPDRLFIDWGRFGKARWLFSPLRRKFYLYLFPLHRKTENLPPPTEGMASAAGRPSSSCSTVRLTPPRSPRSFPSPTTTRWNGPIFFPSEARNPPPPPSSKGPFAKVPFYLSAVFVCVISFADFALGRRIRSLTILPNTPLSLPSKSVIATP